jgi:hypothetical protein
MEFFNLGVQVKDLPPDEFVKEVRRMFEYVNQLSSTAVVPAFQTAITYAEESGNMNHPMMLRLLNAIRLRMVYYCTCDPYKHGLTRYWYQDVIGRTLDTPFVPTDYVQPSQYRQSPTVRVERPVEAVVVRSAVQHSEDNEEPIADIIVRRLGNWVRKQLKS